MTETSVCLPSLPQAVTRFILHWGEMGDLWGVNRSVSQIHALLFVSDRPVTAEEIADTLGMARSNVSNSLKELMAWGLVRRIHLLGDRRDHFEAESDMLEMLTLIARGRKSREIDPTLATLRSCVAQAAREPRVSVVARQRLDAMLGFVETADRSFNEILGLPRPVLLRLLRMGGAIARLLGKSDKSVGRTR